MLWTGLIGLLAGVLARLIALGRREPSGFLLTALLGVAGAFAGGSLGQEAGWYAAGDRIALAGALAGSVVVLAIWAFSSDDAPLRGCEGNALPCGRTPIVGSWDQALGDGWPTMRVGHVR